MFSKSIAFGYVTQRPTFVFASVVNNSYGGSAIWRVFPINAPGMGRFKLFDRVRVIVRVIVAVRVMVSKELGSG